MVSLSNHLPGAQVFDKLRLTNFKIVMVSLSNHLPGAQVFDTLRLTSFYIIVGLLNYFDRNVTGINLEANPIYQQ
jgi:hypothetical protein